MLRSRVYLVCTSASLDEITDGSGESTTAPASAIHYDDGEDTRRCVLCSKVGDDETDVRDFVIESMIV